MGRKHNSVPISGALSQGSTSVILQLNQHYSPLCLLKARYCSFNLLELDHVSVNMRKLTLLQEMKTLKIIALLLYKVILAGPRLTFKISILFLMIQMINGHFIRMSWDKGKLSGSLQSSLQVSGHSRLCYKCGKTLMILNKPEHKVGLVMHHNRA